MNYFSRIDPYRWIMCLFGCHQFTKASSIHQPQENIEVFHQDSMPSLVFFSCDRIFHIPTYNFVRSSKLLERNHYNHDPSRALDFRILDRYVRVKLSNFLFRE